MNKDIYNIFESYTKKLSVAAAKSGAGLPIAKMPLDEDDEGFTPDQVSKIKPKKLPKKVANYPLLKNSFKIFIEDSLRDIISERDYIDQADEGDGYDLAQALQGAGEEARGELEDRIKMDFFNYNPNEPAEYFDTELENLSPDGKKLINDFSDKLATKLTNEFIKFQVPYDAEIFNQYGTPDIEADKHITDVMRANLRSASFPYKYRDIEDLEDIGDKSLPPEMRKRIAKEMLRQNKVLRGLSFIHGRDPVVKNNLMRLSLPAEMADGRRDKMWADIAEYQPDMLYHNPLRKSQQSESERLMRGDQFAIAPLTSNLIKSLDEGLAERGGLNHMLDVIVSGFESPKEIIERLISNPNEIFSFKKFNQIDNRYMQWLREQKAKYHTRGSEEGKDIKTLFEYDDGYKWQQMLTKDACEREGSYMQHCVGGYNPKSNIIISLRDKNNEPHVTLELKEGQLVNPETGHGAVEIHQIKGKSNSMPTKYKDYILRFINQAQHMDIEGLPDFNSMPMVVNDGQALGWVKSGINKQGQPVTFGYFLPKKDFDKLMGVDIPNREIPGIEGHY